MKVQLCYRTKTMPGGKIHAGPVKTLKSSMDQWEKMDHEEIERAYLRRWAGWYKWKVFRWLKEP